LKTGRGCGRNGIDKVHYQKVKFMASVQFILGRSGTGKTRRCLDAVCEALTRGGCEPLILLVPEQATYQAEQAIRSHPDIRGFSRRQSFFMRYRHPVFPRS